MANGEQIEAAAALGAAGVDVELRARMCSAELKAVLEKYGLAIGFKRTEQIMPGGATSVQVEFLFTPAPRAPSN